MKSLSRILVIAAIAFGSYWLYTNYLGHGKKIEINDKSEVYIKQDATQEEATKLGQFLLENEFFDTVTEKSVQLTKENDEYTVRFVIDKARYEADPKVADGFKFVQMLIAKDVFPGKKVDVVLTDDQFKEITKVEPFKDSAETAIDPSGAVVDTTSH